MKNTTIPFHYPIAQMRHKIKVNLHKNTFFIVFYVHNIHFKALADRSTQILNAIKCPIIKKIQKCC